MISYIKCWVAWSCYVFSGGSLWISEWKWSCRKKLVSLFLWKSIYTFLYSLGSSYLHWLWWTKSRRHCYCRDSSWETSYQGSRTSCTGKTRRRGTSCGGYWGCKDRATTATRGRRRGRGSWTRKWRSGMDTQIIPLLESLQVISVLSAWPLLKLLQSWT